jgi:hypothetical protein
VTGEREREREGEWHALRRPPFVVLCAALFSVALRSDSFNRSSSCRVLLPVTYLFLVFGLTKCFSESVLAFVRYGTQRD